MHVNDRHHCSYSRHRSDHRDVHVRGPNSSHDGYCGGGGSRGSSDAAFPLVGGRKQHGFDRPALSKPRWIATGLPIASESSPENPSGCLSLLRIGTVSRRTVFPLVDCEEHHGTEC